MKACGAMGTDDKISGAIESVSFDDTLREIERVIIGDLTDDLTSMVNSINMYEEIMEFEQMIGSGQTTPIDTKYKTVDWKVRPVASPLPKDGQEKMKGVATDPSLRDPLSQKSAPASWLNETTRVFDRGGRIE